MNAISMDLRARIFEARQAGETTAEVAERFAVSPAFVRRLLQRYRETGHLGPKTGPRGPRPKLVNDHDRIRQYHIDHPDHSPAEVRAALRLRVAAVTVWRVFVELGLTFKKKRCTPRSVTVRASGRLAAGGSPGSPPPPPSG
jgi:transposase